MRVEQKTEVKKKKKKSEPKSEGFFSSLKSAFRSYKEKSQEVVLTPAHYICYYHSQGMSDEEISKLLKLDLDLIEACVEQAIDAGKYDFLVEQFKESK